MSEIALANINTFGKASPKADFVPHSEQLITLTYGQLQDLVTQAVEKAIQPFKDEISDLKATVARQGDQLAAMEATASHQDENLLIQLRLINDLREAIKKDPQPLQKDRRDILRALLAANGGKLPEKIARQKMHLSRSQFSKLIATMEEYLEVKPSHLKRNENLLILK